MTHELKVTNLTAGSLCHQQHCVESVKEELKPHFFYLDGITKNEINNLQKSNGKKAAGINSFIAPKLTTKELKLVELSTEDRLSNLIVLAKILMSTQTKWKNRIQNQNMIILYVTEFHFVLCLN